MNETAGEIDVVAAGIEAVAAVPRSRVTLTERELEVLKGMANGQSNAEIGRGLFISEDTIKTHARRLFRKLGARDRAHAVAQGFRAGLLSGADVSTGTPPAQSGGPDDAAGLPGADSGSLSISSLVKLLGYLPSAGQMRVLTLSGVYHVLKVAEAPGRNVSAAANAMIAQAIQTRAGQRGGDLVRSSLSRLKALRLLEGGGQRLIIQREPTLEMAIVGRCDALPDVSAQREYLTEVLAVMVESAGSLEEVAVVYAKLTRRR